MYEAGRIATPPADDKRVSPPPATVANKSDSDEGYKSLMSSLASVTDGFTGAELAGLVRAAASYALERAVGGTGIGGGEMDDSEGEGRGAVGCRVSAEDFGRGLADVLRSKPSAAGSTTRAAMSGVVGAASTASGAAATAADTVNGRAGSSGKTTEKADSAEAPAKSTAAAAAAVAAARLENDIDGSLSPQVRKWAQRRRSAVHIDDIYIFGNYSRGWLRICNVFLCHIFSRGGTGRMPLLVSCLQIVLQVQ